MKYPTNMPLVDVISDYYKNHADKQEKSAIEDALVDLLGDLGFILDDAAELIIPADEYDEYRGASDYVISWWGTDGDSHDECATLTPKELEDFINRLKSEGCTGIIPEKMEWVTPEPQKEEEEQTHA